jgi:hypothetical protein
MHILYTDEAKSLIDETYPVQYPSLRRGTLRKFLHDGSSVIFACRNHERATAATMFTSGVDASMVKLNHMLKPYLHLPCEGLFDGYVPANAYPEGMWYWDSLLCAANLVTVFDMLVALTYKHPKQLGVNPEKLRKAALIYTMRPLVRTARATRIVNSGRPFEQG